MVILDWPKLAQDHHTGNLSGRKLTAPGCGAARLVLHIHHPSEVPLNVPSNNCAEGAAVHVGACRSQEVKNPGQLLQEEEDFQRRKNSVKLGN